LVVAPGFSLFPDQQGVFLAGLADGCDCFLAVPFLPMYNCPACSTPEKLSTCFVVEATQNSHRIPCKPCQTGRFCKAWKVASSTNKVL
jgi:hypothetical protein